MVTTEKWRGVFMSTTNRTKTRTTHCEVCVAVIPPKDVQRMRQALGRHNGWPLRGAVRMWCSDQCFDKRLSLNNNIN